MRPPEPRKASNRRCGGPPAGEGVDGALPSSVLLPLPPGRRKDELRLDAPLPERSLNMNPFSPPRPTRSESLPRCGVWDWRFTSRSSSILRSSLASSNASRVPNRSIATSSMDLPSSSAVSYTRLRRIIRQGEPGPPGIVLGASSV